MSKKDLIKIWFCTDIHGSNACFSKFLKLFDVKEQIMKPNVMIIGGDITGKELVPIKKIEIYGGDKYEYIDRNGSTKSVLQNNIDGEMQLLGDGGKYPIICDESEYQRLEYDQNLYYKRLNDERKKRVEEWIELLEEKIKNNPDVQVFINCGNDDPKFVDKLLGEFQPEGKVINLKDNIKLLSLGYSNLTPWKCPRDVNEEELKKRISKMTKQISNNDILIFNFHCPPFNSVLDEVYEIDQNFQRRNNRKHVGSTSVREAIEIFKPILSLHGHIHEIKYSEKIGSTICVNPGSNYQNGILQGAYFIICDGIIVRSTIVNDLFPEEEPPDPTINDISLFNKIISFIKKIF